MKSIINLIASLSAVFLTFALAPSSYADAPEGVQVRHIAHAGSGCPAGSVAGMLAEDGQAFTLAFDKYSAEIGPDVSYSHKRRNCQLNIDLDIPNGWSFTLFKVEARGYVSLEPGVDALQRTAYYFQGQEGTVSFYTYLDGPDDRNYIARSQVGLNSVVWSPCGQSRALNLNTEVRLDNSANPGGQGLATVDAIDGSFKLIYGVKWRRCAG